MRYIPLFVLLLSMLFDLRPSTAEGRDTVLLYFGSPHCSPCKLMKPRIRALELEEPRLDKLMFCKNLTCHVTE